MPSPQPRTFRPPGRADQERDHAIPTAEDVPPWIVCSMTTPEALPAAKDLPCETQTTIRWGSDHPRSRGSTLSTCTQRFTPQRPSLQPRINLHSGYFPITERSVFVRSSVLPSPSPTPPSREQLSLLGCAPPVFAFSLSRVGRAHPEPVAPPTFRAQPGNPWRSADGSSRSRQHRVQ